MVKVYDMGTYAADEFDCETVLTPVRGTRHADQMPSFPALQLQEIETARSAHTGMPASLQGIALESFLETQD